jgi:hypothetical protein
MTVSAVAHDLAVTADSSTKTRLSGTRPGREPLAHHQAVLSNAKCAQLELVPGRAGAAGLLLAAVLLFVALARGFEIDAEQRRPEQGQDDRRANGAENVGHGISDRHGIQQLFGRVGL